MKKNLSALYIATLFSGIGTGMLLVMVNWVLIETYQSSSLIGALTAASYLISFLVLPQLSVWLDKFHHRVMLQRFYIFGLLIQGIALIFIAQEIQTIFFIIVITITSVVIRLADQMSRLAIAQSLVSSEHFKMISRHLEILRQSITLISGVIVAVLIDSIGLVHILIADILLFVAAAGLLGLIPLPQLSAEQKHLKANTENAFRSIVQSYTYFKEHPSFFSIMALSLAPYVLVLSQNAIHPAHIEQFLQLDGDAYAVMGFVFGAGSLLSPFVSNYLHKQKRSKEIIILCGFLGYLLASIVIMLFPNIWVTYFCLVLFSMSHSMVRIERLAFLMDYVPKDKIGRISGAFELLGLMFVVLCTTFIGFVADYTGIVSAWGTMLVFVSVALIGFIVFSGIKSTKSNAKQPL